MGLRKLNLSWNGFGQAGCLALGQALKENRTLKELDIASNRLTVEAVGGLMKGLQENDGLNILRVSMYMCLHKTISVIKIESVGIDTAKFIQKLYLLSALLDSGLIYQYKIF